MTVKIEIEVTSVRDLLAPTARRIPDDTQPRLFDADRRNPRLYCAGDSALLRRPCVAIVGTRQPSMPGKASARRLARELARRGMVVVSGLARGIDTEALTAAIEAGGRVIAVIGTPLDRFYPAENRPLQEQIGRQHLLVSMFARGQRVRDGNFPRRNRLMAALTDATAIVEAGDRSGTLHQAHECLRLQRWLFIAKSLVDDTALGWPARFLGKPRVLALASADDVISALSRSS